MSTIAELPHLIAFFSRSPYRAHALRWWRRAANFPISWCLLCYQSDVVAA